MQWRQVTWAQVWPLGQITDADIGGYVGVYVIWYVDRIGRLRVLDVGQGAVETRLIARLRDNPVWEEIADFTWTAIPSAHERRGIEAYLADIYGLRGGSHRFPDVMRIAVNNPFAS